MGLEVGEAELLTQFDELRLVENRQPAVAWVLASLARGDEEQALDWLRIVKRRSLFKT